MKKSHQKKGKAKEQEKEESKPKAAEENEKPFDFGGLPQRDLKKNLGCG